MLTCCCVVMALLLGSLVGGGGALNTSLEPADRHRNYMTSSHEQVEGPSIQVLRQDLSLSEYIWQNAVDLLPQAWSTTFIAGVKNGTLDPNFYGQYTLQDASYCRIVAQLWTQLANNVSVSQEVRSYANGSIKGFQDCSTYYFTRWNVKDDGANEYGVIVREPVTQYVTFINETLLAYPANSLFATYACLQLWNNLTADLWPMVNTSTTNVYSVWVQENLGSDAARRQAAQMDEWDQTPNFFNRTQALSLFRTAMLNEINFFNYGGNTSASASAAVAGVSDILNHSAL